MANHTAIDQTTPNPNKETESSGAFAEFRKEPWAKRFVGVPPKRASSVACAIERAGRCYLDEANRNLAVFDMAIQRAIMADNSPITVSSIKAGSKATTATLQSSQFRSSNSVVSHTSKDRGRSNLTDLMEVLADTTNNCIAKQREEIFCLRLAVKELILEIVQQKNGESVPNVIQIQDYSTVDEDSAKGISLGFPSLDESRTPSRGKERNFHFLSSGTVQSKDASVSNSRILHYVEPEGLYTPQQRDGSLLKVNPPSSLPQSQVNDIDNADSMLHGDSRFHCDTLGRESLLRQKNVHPINGNTTLEESRHDKLNDVRKRLLTNTPPRSEDSKLDPSPKDAEGMMKRNSEKKSVSHGTFSDIGDNSRAPLEMSCASPTTSNSTAKERARDLVMERRQRFRNFRLAHERYGSRSKSSPHPTFAAFSTSAEIDTPEPASPVSEQLPTLPSSEEGFLVSLNGEEKQKPLSPIVRLREDELTLMETTEKSRNNRRNKFPTG